MNNSHPQLPAVPPRRLTISITQPPPTINTLPPETIRQIAYYTNCETVTKLRILSRSSAQAISERDSLKIITFTEPIVRASSMNQPARNSWRNGVLQPQQRINRVQQRTTLNRVYVYHIGHPIQHFSSPSSVGNTHEVRTLKLKRRLAELVKPADERPSHREDREAAARDEIHNLGGRTREEVAAIEEKHAEEIAGWKQKDAKLQEQICRLREELEKIKNGLQATMEQADE
ncbi:hypothetical protein HK097_001021 [Rhizophlyctis rosea]|uniref:F-box domain-containing protein n=1 Tax=Rhizophlyctis rosea TaxID=64517 RepID=A0AAD5SMW6_9FUNG|nr:hypothetical protein HK097_001021 [Rhizophlyctis rosea]